MAKLRQEKPKAGFTLVELLTVTVMGTIVCCSLLGLTNQLTRANQREIALSSTQEEMERALNYMARELREAVHVYNGTKLNDIKHNLPASFSDDDKRPILAFWKVEPVPYTEEKQMITDCRGITDATEKSDCEDLLIERRSYTLVVYAQYTANDDNWEGESRIIRYGLRKFKNDDFPNAGTPTSNDSSITTLTKEVGYVEPFNNDITFANWPNNTNCNDVSSGCPNGSGKTRVLVDYVDGDEGDENSNASDRCDTLSREDITAAEREEIGELPAAEQDAEERDRFRYRITPTNPLSGFYACVRDAIDSEGNRTNQDVVLFLRGSFKGRSEMNYDESLPLLQRRVMVRGVINKDTN